MKVYVSHSKNFDFENELYKPLRELNLPIEFIFPHENEDAPFNSKELLKSKGCDYVLAEVSHSSTGQGIELGWADIYQIPIICFYKSGTNPANSLNMITDKIYEYSSKREMVNRLASQLRLNIA